MCHNFLENSFSKRQPTIFMSFGRSKSFSRSLSVQLTATLDLGENGRLATCPLTCVAWEARTDQGIHCSERNIISLPYLAPWLTLGGEGVVHS